MQRSRNIVSANWLVGLAFKAFIFLYVKWLMIWWCDHKSKNPKICLCLLAAKHKTSSSKNHVVYTRQSFCVPRSVPIVISVLQQLSLITKQARRVKNDQHLRRVKVCGLNFEEWPLFCRGARTHTQHARITSDRTFGFALWLYSCRLFRDLSNLIKIPDDRYWNIAASFIEN